MCQFLYYYTARLRDVATLNKFYMLCQDMQ